MNQSRSHPATGMYGVRITGLDECACLEPIPDDRPEWHVTTEVLEDADTPCSEFADGTGGRICFTDGSMAEVARTETGARVHVQLSRDLDRCLIVHPYLAIVGTLSALWGNGIPLHAGAVGINGKAWLVLASKAGGKSTTLLLLDQAGYPVLSDDLSIIDKDLNVQRGPAFIDLRREAAETMNIGSELGVVGARERWRHPIGNRPPSLPLAGVISADWGEPGIAPLTGATKIQTLAGNLALGVPGPWNDLFMNIATTIPILEWTRPKDLSVAGDEIERLLEHIG